VSNFAQCLDTTRKSRWVSRALALGVGRADYGQACQT
jgi:hypothetical protein